MNVVTYRGFFVSEPISMIDLSFERALKTESNKVRMKSIQHLGTELQTFENRKREWGSKLFFGKIKTKQNIKTLYDGLPKAQHTESNETRINATGRFWTKL